MTTIRAMKSLSTARLSIFFEQLLPKVAPTTASTIMVTMSLQSIEGTRPVSIVEMSESTCEKKMQKSELKAAVLVSMLKKYERILKDKGTVEMKTDNVPLFDFSLESFADRGWELLSVTRDLHHEPGLTGNIMTEYEAKFSAQGKPVMKLIAVRPETAK